jgi:hypothetical protein
VFQHQIDDIALQCTREQSLVTRVLA